MIRSFWTVTVAVFATLFYGLIAIGAALFRVRGSIYSWATRGWAKALFRASGCTLTVDGMHNLEPSGPQLIVSNHVGLFDVLAIASVLPMPFHFVAKKELERVPFFGTAWKAAGHISIDRSDRQKAMRTLQEAGRKMRDQNAAVIIFPEGTRSPTGKLLPFKRGAFLLAAEAAVPVIPTVVEGTGSVVRSGLHLIHPAAVRLTFGEPIQPETFATEKPEALMEQVQEHMLAMLRQKESDPRPLP